MSLLTIYLTDVLKTHYLMQIILSDVDTFLEFHSQKIAMCFKAWNKWLDLRFTLLFTAYSSDILFSLALDRCKILFKIFKFSCQVFSYHGGNSA